MTKLRDLLSRIGDLLAPHLVEREIKEVDTWDGAASQYPSTEAYCNACLINVNAAAGNPEPADWTQAYCMLPVREPGDGADVFVDKAIYAIAGGRGIGAVERPDAVPEDAWESAVKGAASKVIAAYEQMDSVAPDAIFTLAGEEPPATEERAVSWGMVYSQVDNAAYQDSMFLHELYTDEDEQVYAIASSMGKLYRASVVIESGAAVLGPWEEVEIQHVPVTRGLLISRQENGQYRWAGVACTAILNKDQEIDSSVLFERFVQRFEQQDRASEPVRLDFWHEDVFLGEVDYLATDNYTLVASGTFRDDEIGRAAAQAIQADPETWGQSISYRPLAAPAFLQVTESIRFPVWEDGKLERIALLPKDRASAWFTTFETRSDTMKTEILEALKRLVGNEQALALAGQVDDVNQRVAGEGLIARTTEPATEPAPTADPEPAPEVADEPPDVRVIRELRADQLETRAILESLVSTLDQFVPQVSDRLERLEQSEQERRAAWMSDLPAPQARQIVRPRAALPDPQTQVDTSDRVHQTLLAKGITQG